jgi:transcription elongation factor S-II
MSVKVENPDQFRSNIKRMLNDKLLNEKNSSNLEKGIFNFTLNEADRRKIFKKWDNHRFVRLYIDRVKSIYLNLTPGLIEQINTSAIKPHLIAFMTHQELLPERWNALIDAKIKRDKNKFETNMEAATDTFTCRKCKSNKCAYYQMQTRSADEPMTTFVTCLDCGSRWKC